MKYKLLLGLIAIPISSLQINATDKIDITKNLPNQIVVNSKSEAKKLLEDNMKISQENEIIHKDNAKATKAAKTKYKTY